MRNALIYLQLAHERTLESKVHIFLVSNHSHQRGTFFYYSGKHIGIYNFTGYYFQKTKIEKGSYYAMRF